MASLTAEPPHHLHTLLWEFWIARIASIIYSYNTPQMRHVPALYSANILVTKFVAFGCNQITRLTCWGRGKMLFSGILLFSLNFFPGVSLIIKQHWTNGILVYWHIYASLVLYVLTTYMWSHVFIMINIVIVITVNTEWISIYKYQIFCIFAGQAFHVVTRKRTSEV